MMAISNPAICVYTFLSAASATSSSFSWFFFFSFFSGLCSYSRDEAFLQNGFHDCLINVLQNVAASVHMVKHFLYCEYAPSSIPDDVRRLNFSHDSFVRLLACLLARSVCLCASVCVNSNRL